MSKPTDLVQGTLDLLLYASCPWDRRPRSR
jgi:hypothetical protein